MDKGYIVRLLKAFVAATMDVTSDEEAMDNIAGIFCEKILKAFRVAAMDVGDPEIVSVIAGRYADKIAKQIRDDQLAIMHCGHHASNVVGTDPGTAYCQTCELEGQVAVMAGVLADGVDIAEEVQNIIFGNLLGEEEYDDGLLESAGYRSQELKDKLFAALQSAPKVLFSTEARWIPSDSLENRTDLIFVSCNDLGDRRVVIGTSSPTLPWEGEAVDVIVLAATNALQEQSKATMPDSECSVNDGPEPKSEQEEPCGM